MNKLKKYLLHILIITILFSSCKEDESVKQGNAEQGKIEFSFSLPSTENQRMKSDAASSILISIEDADGTSVLEEHKVALYEFNGSFISEPIALNSGHYLLTEYLVLNNNNEVIYATPKKDAKLDYLLNDPLPIDFSIERDATQKIIPEVLVTSSNNSVDFGYSTFSFQVLKTFNFLISVFAYDTISDNFQLTTAHLLIKKNGESLFNDNISDSTNRINIREEDASYHLLVEKNGYSTFEKEFSISELKTYGNIPLMINLFSPINLDNGLIAFYPFNMEAQDESNHSYDGITKGVVKNNDRFEEFGKAYKFDGIDDKITFGDELDFDSNDFSVSFWVKVDEFTGQISGTATYGSWIINKGITTYGTPSRAGYGIKARKYNNKNYFHFYLGNQQDQIFSAEKDGYEENEWYHITVIRKSLKQKLYVNGALAASVDLPNEINVNTNIPLVFGSIDKLGNDPGGTSYFNGVLDDVRFYNRALTLEEIVFLYNF